MILERKAPPLFDLCSSPLNTKHAGVGEEIFDNTIRSAQQRQMHFGISFIMRILFQDTRLWYRGCNVFLTVAYLAYCRPFLPSHCAKPQTTVAAGDSGTTLTLTGKNEGALDNKRANKIEVQKDHALRILCNKFESLYTTMGNTSTWYTLISSQTIFFYPSLITDEYIPKSLRQNLRALNGTLLHWGQAVGKTRRNVSFDS